MRFVLNWFRGLWARVWPKKQMEAKPPYRDPVSVPESDRWAGTKYLNEVTRPAWLARRDKAVQRAGEQEYNRLLIEVRHVLTEQFRVEHTGPKPPDGHEGFVAFTVTQIDPGKAGQVWANGYPRNRRFLVTNPFNYSIPARGRVMVKLNDEKNLVIIAHTLNHTREFIEKG
jgi:hypothetical protein